MELAWCLFKCICIILGAADAKLERGICLLIFYTEGATKNTAFSNVAMTQMTQQHTWSN